MQTEFCDAVVLKSTVMLQHIGTTLEKVLKMNFFKTGFANIKLAVADQNCILAAFVTPP
jgi:hypothetical protein